MHDSTRSVAARDAGSPRRSRVLVRGSGDLASAVAHALHAAGWAVLIHDVAQPAHARRGMAFTDAFHIGFAELEWVLARRASSAEALLRMLAGRDAIPVVSGELAPLLAGVQPEVLIDARMGRQAGTEVQRGLAPLVLGVGAGFRAGVCVDLAVPAVCDTLLAEPGEIVGVGRRRFVFAPRSGIFETHLEIGDGVRAGRRVGRIGNVVLCAPLSGSLRGLTYSGVPVAAGAAIIEVDPRGRHGVVTGVEERSRRTAQRVLQALSERR